MIIVDKARNECIGFAVLCDTGVHDEQVEKINKYLDLSGELKKMLIMKVKIVLVVIGALEAPTKALQKRLETISI